ncbi:MAG: BrxA/BrxB family bacilliredoxin, partial [Gemmatimonadetes bacterium]|nr:BrxA/BrxB family bacilliredoxin [Gemmatimonadota bacterium]
SSPSVFLLRDGEVVFALERKDIERRAPEDLADELRAAFDRFCAR